MKRILNFFLLLVLTILPCCAENMRIAQVDNLFFSASNEQSVKNLESVISSINKLKNVDFVFFSGNNIAKPKQEDLESFLKSAKKLKCPFYLIVGNKEVNIQKEFGKKEYLRVLQKNVRYYKEVESLNYVFEKKGILFVVVDGAKEVIPSSMGYYKANTLKWLDEQLNLNSNKKVVILQHFPIVPPAPKESRYTYKAEDYLKLLQKHRNVKAVISGHFGVNKEEMVNDILHISTGEAPTYKIIDIIDCDGEKPIFWSVVL